MKLFVDMKNVHYTYRQSSPDPLLAVNDVTLNIPSGQHVAILGRNGSGKSTLARLINALEQPSSGIVIVSGMNTADEGCVWEIRRLCGMVFQNPDNQIVGTTVEEDVAFGPENLGFPQSKIRQAVDASLAYVGLSDYAQKQPHLLSGGQKQKLAIAGILAMEPSCLILDEATSMLDPVSRRDFMNLVQDLVQSKGMTVINITHHMEEVLLADFAHIISDGKIVASGIPAEVFDRVDLIRSEGLDIPTHTEIAHEIAAQLKQNLLPMEAISWSGAQQAILRMLAAAKLQQQPADLLDDRAHLSGSIPPDEREPIIEVRDLSFVYSPDTAMAMRALDHVSFDVFRGEIFGVIGHSGSGKSTLIQHLNGLIRAQQGHVTVLGMNATANVDIRKIRRHVGLLFQYPEHQLFEETVFQDIAFGPRRMGLEMSEVEQRVLKAAHIVGLKDDELERSPFELSGGQKRRAAIAGVLAMEPDILILDEPAAGLDPAGRDEILDYIANMRDAGVTIILVSHSMEDIARLADRILVLCDGHVHAYGKPSEVFSDESSLEAAGLSMPRSTAFLNDLKQQLPALDNHAYQTKQAVRNILQAGLSCQNAKECDQI